MFLTTHYMEETERADMVYVINNGNYVASGTPQSLRADFSHDKLKLVGIRHKELVASLQKDKIKFSVKNDAIIINVESSKGAMNLLKKYESVIKDFEFVHGNMDDVFLELTKQGEEA